MNSSRSQVTSLLSSLLFIVGAVLFLSVALIMGVSSLALLLTGESIIAQQTIVLAVSMVEALVLIVAAYISIQKYRQKPSAEQAASFNIKVGQVIGSFLIAAIVILIGYWIGDNNSINWFLLPLLTLPAIILPLFILLGMAIRGIPLGARWRTWNIFGIAMTLVPFILIMLEIVVMVGILFFLILFLASQPDFAVEAERLTQQMYALGPESDEAVQLILPYITSPGVIAVALFFFSIVVPMLEEIFKPLGVWLFAKNLSSPSQGFALGALSGAAYALIETMGVSAQTTEWASLLVSRVGTGLLHITTSGLMGAAIVYAIRERQYLRLLGSYILAVSLHGLWNTLAILYSFSIVSETFGQQTSFARMGMPFMIGMVVLGVILFMILILTNKQMKTKLPAPVLDEPIS